MRISSHKCCPVAGRHPTDPMGPKEDGATSEPTAKRHRPGEQYNRKAPEKMQTRHLANPTLTSSRFEVLDEEAKLLVAVPAHTEARNLTNGRCGRLQAQGCLLVVFHHRVPALPRGDQRSPQTAWHLLHDLQCQVPGERPPLCEFEWPAKGWNVVDSTRGDVRNAAQEARKINGQFLRRLLQECEALSVALLVGRRNRTGGFAQAPGLLRQRVRAGADR